MKKPSNSFAQRFLRWFCAPELLEEIEGDLLEWYQHKHETHGEKYAKRTYFLDVLKFFRWSNLKRKPLSNIRTMISFETLNKNLKLTLRQIKKYPVVSAINIIGLAVGISIFLFIDSFVSYEYSYDTYGDDNQSIYRIGTKRYLRDELIAESAGAMPPLKDVLIENVPQVKAILRIWDDGFMVVENPENNVLFEEGAYYVDKEFFEIFEFGLIQGNSSDVLDGPHKVALSERAAEKYFGESNPIGKLLKTTGQSEVTYEVTAVYNNPPTNSHFRPEMVFSFDTYLDIVRPEWNVRRNWIWNDFQTYVKVYGMDGPSLESRVNVIAQQTWGELYQQREVNFEFFTQPFSKIHYTSNFLRELEENSDQRVLSWLSIASILVLLVAWINFINLTTARSLERAKEVSVRKVVGAQKNHLLTQFVTEAFILNLIALITAFIITFSLGGKIASWLELDYQFSLWSISQQSILLILCGGIISAFYPALVLSNFSILSALKGKAKTSRSGVAIRKGLVYVQFIITPLLIGGSYLIYKQVNHLVNRELGANIDQIVVIKGPKAEYDNPHAKLDLFTSRSESSPNVQAMSAMMELPGSDIGWYTGFVLKGDSGEFQNMNVNLAEYNFEDVFGLKLLAGRSFDPAFNDSLSLVINEAGARMWGYTPEEIVGKTLRWSYSPDIPYFDKKVIGLVNNYQQTPYSSEEVPFIYSHSRYTPARFATIYYTVRLSLESQDNASVLLSELERLEGIWKNVYPNDPFNHYFLDDEFRRKFTNEIQFGKVAQFFAFFSILIAGLGLFGLSSYAILKRTKEIGIRKVLGASGVGISMMVILEYIKYILIAYVIAAPLLYFGANRWLQNYAIRIDLDVMLFTLPLVICLVICLISICYQTLKASHQNPVTSLRDE